jgi:hypothetical protein
VDWGPNPSTGGSYPRREGNPRECKIRIWEDVDGSESNSIPLKPRGSRASPLVAGNDSCSVSASVSRRSSQKVTPTPTLLPSLPSATETGGGWWIRCASTSSHPPSPPSNPFPFSLLLISFLARVGVRSRRWLDPGVSKIVRCYLSPISGSEVLSFQGLAGSPSLSTLCCLITAR